MNKVKIAVIGLGNMGRAHCQTITKIKEFELAAVCDINQDKLSKISNQYNVPGYLDSDLLMEKADIDAVLIATPHFDHTSIGIKALKKGLHVLVEKPISVHKADCLRLIDAHQNKKQVFAAMFNQRTDPYYKKVKEMIDQGIIGKILRCSWIITSWFRSQSYYDSGTWRASWKGEGGGVLLNQSPHQLDLLYWLCGKPSRITARSFLGKYHDIEVEDEVTAILEYPNGATGSFITSTGEAPGTNRLEIIGENGRLVVENEQIVFIRNHVSCIDFCQNSEQAFAKPETSEEVFHFDNHGPQHYGILENFARAILYGEKLIAPASEGIHSVELANAMLMSGLKNCLIDLPLDHQDFEKLLLKLQAESRFVKNIKEDVSVDLNQSF